MPAEMSQAMELPGRRSVSVAPLHMTPDGRVKVHLQLHGEHPEHAIRMVTDFSLPQGNTVFVGGMRNGDSQVDPAEVLLVAVTMDRIPERPNPIRATDVNANGRVPPGAPAPPAREQGKSGVKTPR